ncbi:BTB/POZ domain-containing protein 3-like [Sabethes cyaneus]|uniref:BTB/POZ domain-containing protein 3-like n=1 Tax=Sabethes cyaneus TaxID=53552 RepID=UPI00237E0C3E|nr:BTB/POZ domain-containing protein 3-like [Sabethes cyaneus]
MFNGKFTESNDALIPIPDLNLPEFEKTLRFIYTDECIIASVDEAISLFYASKKYMLDKLGKQSITFITCCINPENVLKAYEFATFNEDTELMASCIKLMAARTKEYIQTKSFVNSDLNSVIALFGQKNLAIDSELDLVRALEKYAAYNKCDFRTDAVDTKKSTQDVDVTPSEKLPTIHDAVKHIRWLTFLPSEIAPVLSETKLLTEQEKLDILLNVCSKNAKRAIPAGFDTARESRD